MWATTQIHPPPTKKENRLDRLGKVLQSLRHTNQPSSINSIEVNALKAGRERTSETIPEMHKDRLTVI